MVTERSLAALLLTNRLVELNAKPFGASEYWSILRRVPEPETLLDPQTIEELRAQGLLTESEVARILPLPGASAFAFNETLGGRLLSTFDDSFPTPQND
jgi:hypothetical protein